MKDEESFPRFHVQRGQRAPGSAAPRRVGQARGAGTGPPPLISSPLIPRRSAIRSFWETAFRTAWGSTTAGSCCGLSSIPADNRLFGWDSVVTRQLLDNQYGVGTHPR